MQEARNVFYEDAHTCASYVAKNIGSDQNLSVLLVTMSFHEPSFLDGITYHEKHLEESMECLMVRIRARRP